MFELTCILLTFSFGQLYEFGQIMTKFDSFSRGQMNDFGHQLELHVISLLEIFCGHVAEQSRGQPSCWASIHIEKFTKRVYKLGHIGINYKLEQEAYRQDSSTVN